MNAAGADGSPDVAVERQAFRAEAGDAKLKWRAMMLSVVVGTVLLAVKLAAWLMTGSTAVLSDALESMINVVASTFGLFSIWLSSQPADENHPYGHGKIEYFSAGFEGGLITLAALAILWTAIPRLFAPMPIAQLGSGVLLITLATIANLGLGIHLVRQGKRTGSLTLEADGRHLLTDVATSAAVVFGLGLVRLTGKLWLDPLIAVLLALNILRCGWTLVRQAADRLLDTADPDLLDAGVEILTAARRPGWLEPHHLRATTAGARVNADLHLHLPRFWELARAQAAVEDLERRFKERFGAQCSATIRVDACRPRHCPRCDLADCPVRGAAFVKLEEWTTENVKSSGPHPE